MYNKRTAYSPGTSISIRGAHCGLPWASTATRTDRWSHNPTPRLSAPWPGLAADRLCPSYWEQSRQTSYAARTHAGHTYTRNRPSRHPRLWALIHGALQDRQGCSKRCDRELPNVVWAQFHAKRCEKHDRGASTKPQIQWAYGTTLPERKPTLEDSRGVLQRFATASLHQCPLPPTEVPLTPTLSPWEREREASPRPTT